MHVPGYKIEKELGRGGMATVYLALQENLDRQVALKVMSPALLSDPSFSSRFLREAKIVAQLSHPHIISIYDVSTNENRCYIAMEYQPGGELNTKIKSGLLLQDTITIINEIANALSFAHDKGYVHRDVKPANILFNSHGKSLLSDFGVAREYNSTSNITEVGSVIGTPLYMSPEQAQGKKVDHRADLYSLGAVFYEMLTGAPPFRGESPVAIAIKHMTDTVPDLPERYVHLQHILNKVLHKDPDERYQSGTEFSIALEKIEPLDTTLSSINNNVGLKTVLNLEVAPTQKFEPPFISFSSPMVRIGLVSSILIGILIITGSLFFDQAPEKLITVQPEPTEIAMVAIPATETSDKVQTPPTLLTLSVEQRKINELLSRADQLLANNQYMKPQQNNAYQQYLAVLDIDENNQRAKLGMRTISNYFVNKIPFALKANQFRRANKFLTQAKSIYPQRPDIDTLQAKIAASKLRYNKAQLRIAAQNKIKRKSAVTKARLEQTNIDNSIKRKEQKERDEQRKQQLQKKQQLKQQAKLEDQKRVDTENSRQRKEKQQRANIQSQLTSAKNLLEQANASANNVDKAHEIIKEIIVIDPNNSAIEIALKGVVYGYANLADTALNNSEHIRAEGFVNKGLAVNNKNSRLLQLKTAIKKSRDEATKVFGGF